MKFDILKDNRDIVDAIINDNFVKELVSGSLDKKRFDYYISQDIDYLKTFARASAICTAKADGSDIDFFINMQSMAVDEIKSINNFYSNSADFIFTEGRTRATLHYSNFTIDMAYSNPIEVAFSALYPCPWLYMYIGQLFGQSVEGGHRYYHWLKSNGNAEYPKLIAEFDELLSRYATQSPNLIPNMKGAMREALIHEYHFWHDAYNFNNFDKL